MAETIRITGLKEVDRSFRQMRKETLRELRPALREAGELVRRKGQALFTRISPHSAAGYKVRVRQRGVAVEQSLKRTTGLRPDFGSLQMRIALVPALNEEGAETIKLIDLAVNKAESDAGF